MVSAVWGIVPLLLDLSVAGGRPEVAPIPALLWTTCFLTPESFLDVGVTRLNVFSSVISLIQRLPHGIPVQPQFSVTGHIIAP